MLGLMAKDTLEASKKLKGAISDKEKPFLEDASAGRISWTPEALQHLAGITIAASHNAMLNAAQQHSGARSVTGADEISKLYPLPPFSYGMDPDMFPETQFGRVRYQGAYSSQGGVPDRPGVSAPKPTVSNWGN